MQRHFLGVQRPTEATSPSFPALLFASPRRQPSNGRHQCLDIAIPESPMSITARTVRPVQNFFLCRFCGMFIMHPHDLNQTNAVLSPNPQAMEEMLD